MQSSVFLYAEGSVDFINYDGYRLFLRADKDQQIKVFARGGEFLNFGSSHLGIEEGFISVYKPDGTLHAVYDGSNGNAGIIHNNIEEVNGPVGGAGYNPEVIEVAPSEEGVWTLVFSYPTNTGAEYTNLLNDAPWTREADQPTNRRVILAWDVTVSENAAGPQGGDLKTGRVYTNEYNSMISGNGITTSPMFYILTPDGLQYEVVFNETDPWGFPITSSSLGLLDHTGQPTYLSWTESQVTRSDDPSTWTEGNIYQYEPQAQDNGNLINNKIFFNMPDISMPGFAQTTDVFRNNTYTDWLYKEPLVFDIIFNDFTVYANDEEGEICNAPGIQFNTGAYFVFDSNTSGNVSFEMDINNDGDLDDPEDRIIVGYIDAGIDSLFWDGTDGLGNPIPVQEQFTFSYQFYLRGGENHITLSDVENNVGGVTFNLLSDVGAVDTDLFFYDHSNVAGGVSGGGTPGNPLATNVPFTYDNQYGNKKMLDYWSYIVYTDNGGGLLSVDILEDCTVYVAPDTDGDGLTDDIDIDDDNDGISDMREYCNEDSFACLPGGSDPSGDEDGDGIRNYLDSDDPAFTNPCPDANGNGICDSTASVYDTDGDNIPDHLDLDSDNDGISDLEEAKHGALDADKNGVIDGESAAFGDNGLFNELATDADDAAAVINYTVSDKDNDGIIDADDLDSDNDGINDVREAGNYDDFDNDGMLNNSPIPVDINGVAGTLNGLMEEAVDSDQDGVKDFRDLDADNDTFLDVGESGYADGDEDGIVGTGVPSVDSFGRVQTAGDGLSATSEPLDIDADGIPNYLDLDSDNDAINDVIEYRADISGNIDPDNDGVGGFGLGTVDEDGILTEDPAGNPIESGSNPANTDEDNRPDVWDLDSDNDGINDVEEGGNADPDNDGIINTGMPEVNENGQAEGATSFPDDADEDTYPNYLDLDSDNDGINDVEEAGHPDADNDGIIGTGTPVVNENGQAAAAGSPDTTSDPQDTDGDEVPDYLDLDSDNDGINDVEEGGNEDPDNDGDIGSGLPEVNEDGQAVSPTGDVLTGSNPQDTDGDNVPDYHDLDSDNDGIKDVTEAGHDDPDFDGVAGTGMPQVNEDGQPEVGNTPISISNPVDSDGDEIPDYQDLDSDNDGINDVEEAGNLDPDNDGIVGVGMPPVDENGLTDPENPELPIDTDEDGTPDYLDSDSDDDGISDVIEAGFLDPDDDGVVGTGTPVVNDNGQPNGSTSDPTDTDGDGIPDYQELDSDDDGLPDEGECPDDNTCLDWDEDGIPDFQDVDSDNDGIPDETECETGFECPDTDGDGIPDYHDLDTDGDGIPDEEECPNGNACPDSDGDGIPDWRDPACNGVTDFEITNLTGEGTYCTGEDIVLTASPDIDFSEPVSFTWNGPLGVFNGTATSAAGLTYTIPTAQTSAEGFYSLSVLTEEGCGGTSNSIFINVIITPATPSLSTANTTICAGDDLVLQASPAAGENPTYLWYADGQPVTETTSSTLTVFGASAAAGGVYTVQVADGSCPSLPSNEVEITIVEPIENITATNSTTESSPACFGTNVLLSVPFYEGATYQWFGPNGEVGTGFAVGLSDVNPADAGAYYAIITFAECGTTTSSFTNVFVADETVIPILTSDNDEICEGESVTLSIINDLGINPEDAVTFTWINLLNGETVAETTEPELTLDNLSQAGDYVVTFTINGCEESSESYFITVNETPDEEATIPNDVAVLCGNEAAILEAIAPNEGSGRWTSLGEATILSAENNVTQAVNLSEGENIFVWTLSTDACPDYSTDTLRVFTASAFAVNDDIFEIQQNTDLTAADIVSNDDLFNLEAFTVSVTEEPNSGVVTLGEDGLVDFTPEADFTGVVTFMYEVCKTDCPDDCLAATVTILISEDEPSGECFVPNGITPNGDDKNDFLEIPCLEGDQFPQNSIMIFNRWGDKVYETVNYQNDWGGTFRGRQLPAGTYFYILQVEPNSTPIQDFFTIVY